MSHTLGYQDNTGLYVSAEKWDDTLTKMYTLRNLYRDYLIRQGDLWMWRGMPEFHKMYKPDHLKGRVKIPLGILGTTWGSRFENRITYPTYPKIPHTIQLTELQQEAMQNLKEKRVGIMNATTGTGKSYMILHEAAENLYKTLILVSSTPCMTEMITKCQELLQVTPEAIGGKKKTKPTTDKITVCMVHSLSKVDMFQYGTILADEVDKCISTETRQDEWFRCSPINLYGFTATLTINHWEPRLIRLFFWEPEQTMKVMNFTPEIIHVPTNFMYSGDLSSFKDFWKLVTEVCLDQPRNNLIIETIVETLPTTETKKGLLLVSRIEQATILHDMLTERGIKSHIIIWETSEEDRQRIREEVTNTPDTVVLIGSPQILGRWFDLPALQVVYLVFPNKFDEQLVQVTGRVLRKHECKTYARVYDFADVYEEALRAQWMSRKKTYRQKYWVVS